MKQDRFLIGILVGIAALIVVALAIFFTRQQVSYNPEQTPEAVVHNYVLAVLNKDYHRAFTDLADLSNKPTFDEFRQAFAVGRLTPQDVGVKIGGSDITADGASVEVTLVTTPGDPFSTGYDTAGLAQLVRQNDAWKISYMPAYNLWDFSWYQSEPK